MKIVNYEQPKSSFLSIDKDMNQITNRILDNDRLCKMLYYSSPDALRREPLTLEQKQSMFGKNIKIVPKLTVDNEVLQYLVIGFSNFITNPTILSLETTQLSLILCAILINGHLVILRLGLIKLPLNLIQCLIIVSLPESVYWNSWGRLQ